MPLPKRFVLFNTEVISVTPFTSFLFSYLSFPWFVKLLSVQGLVSYVIKAKWRCISFGVTILETNAL